MTLFIQDSPWDYLMYYPLIRELQRKGLEWHLLDLEGKTVTDLVYTLSTQQFSSVILWGDSELKLTAMLVLKNVGIKTFLLEGDRRLPCYEQNHLKSSILNGMSSLAWVNLVDSDLAKTFLIKEGVNTQVTLIESPISNLACKLGSEKRENNAEILICVSDHLKKSTISSVTSTGKTWVATSPREMQYRETDFYGSFFRAGVIISDSFIFDATCAELGKHFLYIGNEVTRFRNLGITTHLITGKYKELQEYVKQTWSPLPIRRPEYGLQSLLKYL